MRGTFVIRNGEIVEKGGPKDIRQPAQRSDLPCPMLISDHMPEAEHVDGNFYSSKSRFRAVTRERGLIEVGNDAQRFGTRKRPDRKARERSIEQSIDKAIAQAS